MTDELPTTSPVLFRGNDTMWLWNNRHRPGYMLYLLDICHPEFTGNQSFDLLPFQKRQIQCFTNVVMRLLRRKTIKVLREVFPQLPIELITTIQSFLV